MNFNRRAEIICMTIPVGKVVSYGQIALLCGMPNYARQVGRALSHILLGEDIPAHRIVNCRGVLSGAKTFDTPNTQRRLLEKEGVMFLEENRVDMRSCAWKTTFNDSKNFQKIFEKLEI